MRPGRFIEDGFDAWYRLHIVLGSTWNWAISEKFSLLGVPVFFQFDKNTERYQVSPPYRELPS